MSGVKPTYLRKNKDCRAFLGHVNHKFGAMVIGRPRDVQSGPLLRDSPLRAEEAGSVEMLIFFKQVVIRYPEELECRQ